MCASICRIPLPETKERSVVMKITSIPSELKVVVLSVMMMMVM